MTSQEATKISKQAADYLSQMIRLGHLPKDRRSEACDLAIDLNRLSQAHAKASAEMATAGVPPEDDPPY